MPCISFAIGPEAGSFLRPPKNPCACPIHRTLLIQRIDEILHVGLVLRITKTVLRSCQSSISRLHRREVVPLLWSSGKTSRPLAPNRTTQSDYGTHFGLRRDVVPLLWSYRKTSRPLAPNRTTQSDYGTHFGLRRDVVPLLWSYRKTSRPLAPNRTTQSDYGTHFGLRRDVVPLLWSYRKTSRPLAPNRTIQSD
ncbi:unnamed protein product [Gadus morhua 'NCC']